MEWKTIVIEKETNIAFNEILKCVAISVACSRNFAALNHRNMDQVVRVYLGSHYL